MIRAFRFHKGFLRFPEFEKKTGFLWAVTGRSAGNMKDPKRFAQSLNRLGLKPNLWAGDSKSTAAVCFGPADPPKIRKERRERTARRPTVGVWP